MTNLLIIIISITISFLPQITSQELDTDNIPVIKCGNEICDSIGGYCSSKLKCICYDRYATRIYSTIQCDYKMISKFKAGIIELIFGFGFGQFYALRKTNGQFKLFLYIVDICCFITCLYYIRKIRDEEEAEDHPYVSLFVLFTVLFSVSLIIWQVVDGFMFMFGSLKDGNGMMMY